MTLIFLIPMTPMIPRVVALLTALNHPRPPETLLLNTRDLISEAKSHEEWVNLL